MPQATVYGSLSSCALLVAGPGGWVALARDRTALLAGIPAGAARLPELLLVGLVPEAGVGTAAGAGIDLARGDRRHHWSQQRDQRDHLAGTDDGAQARDAAAGVYDEVGAA